MLRLLLLLLLVIGCDSPRPTPGTRMRVVSLSPSTTEAMFALGAGELLVARTEQCDHPPEARKLPTAGAFGSPDIERIVALAPTLVIGSQGPTGPALEDRLRAQHVATFFPATTSVDEIGQMLLGLGAKVGRAEQAARTKAAIDRRLLAIERWVARRPKVSVVVVFDPRPLFVAGPGGFVDELVRRAGGKNAVVEGGLYPTIDLERLLSLDPDVIVDAAGMGTLQTKLAELPGWSALRAVRERRLRKLSNDAALRPGPRIAEGLRAVAEALHGEAP